MYGIVENPVVNTIHKELVIIKFNGGRKHGADNSVQCFCFNLAVWNIEIQQEKTNMLDVPQRILKI